MKRICIIFFFVFCFNIQAQEDSKIVKSFDSLVLNSNNWQQYRVIKKVDIKTYKDELISISDSLSAKIKALNTDISSLEESLTSSNTENKALKAELSQMKDAKDDMNLIGITLPKSTYIIIVWSIILVLILGLSFVIIKLRNKSIVTQEIKENLENTTKEFEDYKHRAIEKQQKLGRELLDAQKLAQARNQKK